MVDAPFRIVVAAGFVAVVIVTRRDHTLATHGPYRWVRHPFYSSMALVILANALVAANWFFLLIGALVFGLIVLRTSREEVLLMARFGDAYGTSMKRTGWFVPRWPIGQGKGRSVGLRLETEMTPGGDRSHGLEQHGDVVIDHRPESQSSVVRHRPDRVRGTIMNNLATGLVVAVATLIAATRVEADWPAPKAPVVPEADGYVVIPNAAVTPDPSRTYRAVFDATRAAEKPTQLVPALNMAGSELNALGATGVPWGNVKFALVFHGDALAGILDEAHYKAKFGVSNPNLKVITALKKAGVELFVCGQNLAFEKIDPKTLTPDVTIASDALIVLMTYQNKGYALISF